MPRADEPRVVTSDVQALLRSAIRPDDPDLGEAVSLVAHLADTSTRTVYRVLGGKSETLDLGLADRLAIAVGEHLSACRLKFPDGRVVPYLA